MVSLAKPLTVEFSTWIGVALVVRGGYKVPYIYTVGGPGAAVVGCIVYYDMRAWRC